MHIWAKNQLKIETVIVCGNDWLDQWRTLNSKGNILPLKSSYGAWAGYGSTPMSYANLSDMLQERGISVNRSTIYRWFIEYAPALRKKLRRRQFIRADSS